MTEAYAIKGPDGIIRRTMADSSRDAWMLYLGGPKEMHRQVTAELAGLRCVPVAVSEKGEADEPPMMDLGDYYGIQVGPFVYMQRKTIQTATDAPMEDYEKAILNLCAYLSRVQG